MRRHPVVAASPSARSARPAAAAWPWAGGDAVLAAAPGTLADVACVGLIPGDRTRRSTVAGRWNYLAAPGRPGLAPPVRCRRWRTTVASPAAAAAGSWCLGRHCCDPTRPARLGAAAWCARRGSVLLAWRGADLFSAPPLPCGGSRPNRSCNADRPAGAGAGRALARFDDRGLARPAGHRGRHTARLAALVAGPGGARRRPHAVARLVAEARALGQGSSPADRAGPPVLRAGVGGFRPARDAGRPRDRRG
ncbi:hypothetical protein HBB16_20720 [Pseudonocardia sp. MCCB 268]|nr:hypothetical protein [Pseudonocardia cytotoxica]